MANRLNVAARLAEGRSAVEHTQTYVWACHALGYQHPDLTIHGCQVRDWYDSEDGLDLWVLDDDCAKLRAAANATDEALSRQRAQLAVFAGAWSGPGGAAALSFLQRHCHAGEAVVADVRAAAERCAALRDELWQLIDRKVLTAIAVDDRRLAERPAWLAAAQTVMTRAGDRAVAEKLVEQQVEPYVDNDIRGDWLTAMRSTPVSVDASFDAVTDAVTATPPARFELPGDLGLRCQQFDEPLPPIAAVSVPITPAAGGATPPVDPEPAKSGARAPAPPWDPGTLSTLPPTVPAGALDGLPPVPPSTDAQLGDAGLPAGDLGGAGGLGGLAGSIGGVIGQIVGGIGSLLGSLADGLAEPADDAAVGDELDADDPEEQLDDEADDPRDEEPDGEDAEPAAVVEGAEEAPPEAAGESPPMPNAVGNEPTADAPAADAAPPADAPPPAELSPPPADPGAPAADPGPDESTPCEIAADELPQAGQ
ncbi:MAG: hypothetical protein JOZ23_03370 [Mycobacterium sp.]|nr:hypothetical protein [Mycobacterium sp.]